MPRPSFHGCQITKAMECRLIGPLLAGLGGLTAFRHCGSRRAGRALRRRLRRACLARSPFALLLDCAGCGFASSAGSMVSCQVVVCMLASVQASPGERPSCDGHLLGPLLALWPSSSGWKCAAVWSPPSAPPSLAPLKGWMPPWAPGACPWFLSVWLVRGGIQPEKKLLVWRQASHFSFGLKTLGDPRKRLLTPRGVPHLRLG